MAVLLAHVVDQLGAAVLAHVDVDVGVLAAVRVGEPLEEQPVADRARRRQSQHVTDHGADAGTARRGRNAAPTRFVDEIPHDQEVRRDPLVRENPQFAIEPFVDLVGDIVAIPPRQPEAAQFAQGLVAQAGELVGRRVVVE